MIFQNNDRKERWHQIKEEPFRLDRLVSDVHCGEVASASIFGDTTRHHLDDPHVDLRVHMADGVQKHYQVMDPLEANNWSGQSANINQANVSGWFNCIGRPDHV